jgi:hypothetical protein
MQRFWRKLAMMLSASRFVGFIGFLWGIKKAQMKLLSAALQSRSPFVFLCTPANAAKPASVVGAKAAIAVVLRTSGNANICHGVIQPVTINMVDAITHINVGKQPVHVNEAAVMRFANCINRPNFAIGAFGNQSGPIPFSNHFSIFCIYNRKKALRQWNPSDIAIKLHRLYVSWHNTLYEKIYSWHGAIKRFTGQEVFYG